MKMVDIIWRQSQWLQLVVQHLFLAKSRTARTTDMSIRQKLVSIHLQLIQYLELRQLLQMEQMR